MGRGDEIDEIDDDEIDDEIDEIDEIDDDETEGASGGTRIGQRNFEFGIARTDSPRLPALAPSWSLVVCVSRDAFPGMRVQKFELEYSQRGTSWQGHVSFLKDVGTHTHVIQGNSRYPYHPTTMRLFDFSDTDSTLISLSSISVRLSRRRNH